MSNRVGNFELTGLRETGGDDVFRDPTGEVCGGTVDLGGVLTGEGTAPVTGITAIGVDDNLASSQTGVALGAADYKFTGGVDQIFGIILQELSGEVLANDFLDAECFDLFVSNVCGMLG